MSHKRAQEQSLRAATETRLGVARIAESVTRQAALERARLAPVKGWDLRPALPDASARGDDRALRMTLEQSEIERFRTVLGGARCAGDLRSGS